MKKSFNKIDRQYGLSLISILVGLLISSIAIGGMLSAYKNTVDLSARATPAAREDGERVAALMRAHMLLQKAGYGIDGPEFNTDLLRFDNLTWIDSGGGSLVVDYSPSEGDEGYDPDGAVDYGDAVIWSTDQDLNGNLECEGLVPTATGGLKWITAACTNAAGWGSVSSWSTAAHAGARSTANVQMSLNVAINNAVACSPMGGGSGSGEMEGIPVTMSVTLSTGETVTNTTCLYNFEASGGP